MGPPLTFFTNSLKAQGGPGVHLDSCRIATLDSKEEVVREPSREIFLSAHFLVLIESRLKLIAAID